MIPDLAPELWGARLLTSIGGALDWTVLRGMALAFGGVLVPTADESQRLRTSGRPYTTPALLAEPRRFFDFLDQDTPVAQSIEVTRREIAGGSIVTRCFTSGYEPYHQAESADACPENDTIWVDHWVHESGPPRATLLAIHGFTMGWPQIDAHLMMIERWFRMGLDVAQITLPFHGARATARCHYSGERFASWDIGRLNEAVRQSVHDAHLVARWLTHRNGAPVGALGMSLGGYLTALLAALLPDLAFAIPVVPAVCLGDLPTRLFAQSRAGRGGFSPPLSLSDMRRGYHVHSPLTYPLALPRERVLIIGARGDGVTPIAHARALWDHWGRPSAIWFSGGHVAPFQRSRVAAAVATHLAKAGVIDADQAAAQPSTPPMRLVRLPTRVGPPQALPTQRRASSLQPNRLPLRSTRNRGQHAGSGMGMAASGAGERGA